MASHARRSASRIQVRPRFEATRDITAHARCRVIFTGYEMKRLGRDAAELTALADPLTAHGLISGDARRALPGTYDPSGPGPLLFAFFAAMAEPERQRAEEYRTTRIGALHQLGSDF